MLDLQPEKRPSVHKILEKPLIKKHMSQILNKTINLHDENMISSHQLKNTDSSRKLFKLRRSLSSLSSSILTPKGDPSCSNKENTKGSSRADT